jgi:hypothetical protein
MSHSTPKGGSRSDGEMRRPACHIYFCKSVLSSKLNPLIREIQLPSKERHVVFNDS